MVFTPMVGGCVERRPPRPPPCFLVFVFFRPPATSDPPGPALYGRSKTHGLGLIKPRLPPPSAFGRKKLRVCHVQYH